jgi:hypothetical protein
MPELRWKCRQCRAVVPESALSRTSVTVKRVSPPHVLVERQERPCCPQCWAVELVEVEPYKVA